MLTLAIVFLLIAIAAGVFGIIAAGPTALVIFFVFLALFVVTIGTHYIREYRRPVK